VNSSNEAEGELALDQRRIASALSDDPDRLAQLLLADVGGARHSGLIPGLGRAVEVTLEALETRLGPGSGPLLSVDG
jgi:hypothetical protein